MTASTPARTFSEPRQVLDAWIKGVNDLDIDSVVSLYSSRPVLLATFAPQVVRDEAGLRQYFTQLGSRVGLNVRIHDRTVLQQELDESKFVLTGIYTFSFEIEEEPLSFASRFTFVMDLDESHPIRHHHSSMIPRTLN